MTLMATTTVRSERRCRVLSMIRTFREAIVMIGLMLNQEKTLMNLGKGKKQRDAKKNGEMRLKRESRNTSKLSRESMMLLAK
jgi:hypothetical protein